MKTIVVKDYQAMSQKCAELIIDQINNKPDSILGLATGGTPMGAYQLLIEAYQKGLVDFSKVKTFNLDEYCGISINHPQSYHYYMFHNFFNHINIQKKNIHIPCMGLNNNQKACENYNQLLNKETIDIQLLGIGSNGHIAFNEPGTPFDLETHIVELSLKTREDNQRFFSSLEEVPTHAITMGIKNILKAKKIVMLISGFSKKEAVKRLLIKEISTDFPASALLNHNDVTVIIDEEAYI